MSKKVNGILVLVCLLGLGLASGQEPLAKERTITVGQDDYLLRSRLKSILNANFTFNFHHNQGKVTINNTLERLSNQEGWTVKEITNPALITMNELQQHEVLVLNNISNINGGGLSNSTEDAIQEFIEGGGGNLMIHGSGDGTGSSWPWFSNTLHSVGYAGHGARTNAETFRGADADGHVVMEGIFEGGMEITYGEWYKNNLSIYDNPNAEVLLEFDPTTCGGCIEQQYIHDGGNGVVWSLQVGAGKSIYFPYGHDDAEMDGFNDPGKSDTWDNFYNQALYYLAGYDSLKIGCMDSNADNYDPDAEVDSDPSSCVTVDIAGYDIRVDNMTFHRTNPAVVFNKSGNHSIKLTDTRGKTIDEKSYKGISQYQVDPANLGSGVYLLQATSNGKTHFQRYFIN